MLTSKKIKTADIFKLARLMKKVNVWEFIKKFRSAGADIAKLEGVEKENATKALGTEAFVTFILELSDPNAEKEIYSLIEGISGRNDIGSLPIEELVAEVISILKENDLTKVFSIAQGLSRKL